MTQLKKDEDIVINASGACNPAFARQDANKRNMEAYQGNQDFFDNPAHVARVSAARKILNQFFKVKDIYENQRSNRGKPFTVLKVTNHTFPKVSFAEKARTYREPLEELGVEFVVSSGTNSLLYRIY